QRRDIALYLQGHRLPDEEAAVGFRIDQLPVLGIYRVHAQADVRLTNAKIDHELSQGLRPDSPAAHRPHCWHPWVVPARILSGLNRLPQLAGAERPELMDLNPAPVNDPGVLPSEVRVQIPLPAS